MNRKQAEEDYRRFWELYPDQLNPSDINTEEKFEYAMDLGWQRLNNMQKARKSGYDFTRLNKGKR